MRSLCGWPVGSGKTTFARKLSEKTGVPAVSLDTLVHIPDPSCPPFGNRKRPEAAREALFREILTRPGLAD